MHFHIFFILFIAIITVRNIMELKFKPSDKVLGSKDKQRKSLLTQIFFSINFLSSFIATAYFLLLNPEINLSLYITGLTLFLLAYSSRVIVITQQLKENYSYLKTPNDQGFLVVTGVYSIIRHPLYLLYMIELLSFNLIQFNLIALGAFILNLITTVQRIKEEEKELGLKFKEKYVDYQLKTKKLIPYLY